MIEPDPHDGFAVLKIETHLHTLHSDGQHSVAAMFAACRSAGYAAVALTDHNTTSGLAEAEAVAADLGLVLIPGVEVTTFAGHAVALGVSTVPEWRDLEQRGFDALARDVHEAGGVLCIAHPTRLGSPLCSGCAWDWPIQPTSFDLWEVFSAPQPHYPHPAMSLALWRTQLAAGSRSAPVAAGDVHSTAAASAERPATFVCVTKPTRQGVLEALGQRRLFASRGRRLDFWLEDGPRTAAMGSRVEPGDWQPRTSPAEAHVETLVTPTGTCHYALLRTADGELEAISAPIWIDRSQRGEASV